MVDYYPLLRRTLGALDSHDAEMRRRVYERAWTAARDKWRARTPPPTEEQIRAEFSALKAAIEQVEADYAPPPPPPAPPPLPAMPAPEAPPAAPAPAAPAPIHKTPPRWVRWAAVAAVAAVAAMIGVVALVQHRSGKPEGVEAAQAAPPPQRPQRAATASYVFTRQPVYYRSTYPVGTLVIDKAQWFVYVIQPNVVAIRYGLAVGPDCGDVAGLRTVAAKHDIGGLPVREGATEDRRYLLLDPGTLRLNAALDLVAIGGAAPEGCFRVSPEDVGDLFARVQVGARVIVGN